MYSEPSQTSNIELFTKIVNGRNPRTIFAKKLFLDVLLVLSTPPRKNKDLTFFTSLCHALEKVLKLRILSW